MLHAAEFVTRDVRRAVGLLESAAQQVWAVAQNCFGPTMLGGKTQNRRLAPRQLSLEAAPFSQNQKDTLASLWSGA